METLIELEAIEKRYQPGLFRKPIHALRGLDLAVRRGEIYALLGPNGAGKTTAFKILLGLVRPTSGRGSLLHQPLGSRAARARLGFLPELPSYYPHLTPRELLRFARDLSGVPADEARDRTLLESLGLELAWQRPLKRLSKGQVQRLGLAQALVHDPDLLVLDEPMSGLDPIGRGLVKDRLRAERARGRTLLLASHVLADVEVLADTVGFLREGQLQLEGAPAELLASAVLEVVIEADGTPNADLVQGLAVGAECVPAAGGGFQVRLPRPAPLHVDACLRRLLASGATILSVETRREDLERFFLRIVAGREPARFARERFAAPELHVLRPEAPADED